MGSKDKNTKKKIQVNIDKKIAKIEESRLTSSFLKI